MDFNLVTMGCVMKFSLLDVSQAIIIPWSLVCQDSWSDIASYASVADVIINLRHDRDSVTPAGENIYHMQTT